MNEALVQQVFRLVKEACFSDANHFGKSVFTNHICEVVKFSALLSRELNADEEIVVLAALLHDYSGIVNYAFYPEHHVYSAKNAFEILCQMGYPTERSKRVAQCILEHRGSVSLPQQSLESICLASADAMAHISKWHSLLHYAQSVKHLTYREAKVWVFKKLSRSWNKMCESAKVHLYSEYSVAIQHLKSEMAS